MEHKFAFLKKLEEYKKQQEEQKNQEELKTQEEQKQTSSQEISQQNSGRYDLMMTHKLRRLLRKTVVSLTPAETGRIRYYLRKNASPNVRTGFGEPLWEIVMLNNDYGLFVQLLNSGLNLNDTNNENETPLMYAIRLNNNGIVKSNIVELLEERKINDLQDHQTQNEENEYKF